MKIVFEGRFPGMNDILKASKAHRMQYAKMKRDETERVRLHCLKLEKLDKPVFIDFQWFEPNARRDPDNFTAGGRKMILDGLVAAGVLPDDRQKNVLGWRDEWFVDSKNPRVVVHLEEYDEV